MKQNEHHLIQRVLDGAVNQAEFKNFQQRLRQEPGLLEEYQQYALLHHVLSEEFEMMPFGRQVVSRSQRWWMWLGGIGAAAALWMLFFHALSDSSPSRRSGPTARVSFSSDATWQIDGDFHPNEQGIDLLPGGTIRLLHGQAAFTLANSATAIISGPSSLEYEYPNRLMLHEGKGRFRMEANGSKFEVATPSMIAVDLGTEFAIEVREGAPDELHVIEGKVQMLLSGKSDGPVLVGGEAGRVTSSQSIEKFAADDTAFAKRVSEFQTIATGPSAAAPWSLAHGEVVWSHEGMAGTDFQAFSDLPGKFPSIDTPVMLVTLRIKDPHPGDFHTDGWSGMSFHFGDEEILFFGDSHGPEITWSIDVKQGQPVVLPGRPLAGPREVTLRYDSITGRVTLHEGSGVLPDPFCEARIPPGSQFDRIRFGASENAALHVSSYTIRVGNSAY